MKRVLLGPSRIESTQLGFGCAQLFRLQSSRRRLALLHEAFKHGVRHFDVSRMYGLGAAEAVVGKFALGRRDQIVIATKFGIPLSRNASRLRFAQGALRAAMTAVPALKAMASSRGPAVCTKKDFSPQFAEQSLRESLKQLRTDYVDILFLHEPTSNDGIAESLVEWLENRRKAGMIREYGLSGQFEDVVALGKQFPTLRRVTQFASDLLNSNRRRYYPIENEGVSTYSTLSSPLQKLREFLSQADSQTETLRWTSAARGEIEGRFARYCLAGSVSENPDGVTLFSTTQTARIVDLISAVRDQSLRKSDDLAEIIKSLNGYAKHPIP